MQWKSAQQHSLSRFIAVYSSFLQGPYVREEQSPPVSGFATVPEEERRSGTRGWYTAGNEKAYHEIVAGTTCEFVNKELLQELDKTRNASKLEDDDRVAHNLTSYLASFERISVYKKSSLMFMVGC
jgi:hypothetical protein